jgi:hypothetical protein
MSCAHPDTAAASVNAITSPITTPETYTVGTLVVDLFDARTMQLIWRGVGTETLSDKPEKDTQKLNKTVEKMFKDFPPKSK